jgi:diacylglycerol O-acyltransferase
MNRLRGGQQHHSVPVPRTVFNEPLTEQRAVAFASIPVDDMKWVKNAFDVSNNSVFLAGCTLSLRNWLQRHDALPDYPLLMQMPLSGHDADSRAVGNQFRFGPIRMPVQLDDPVQVLMDLHAQTQRLTATRSGTAENSGPTLDFPTTAQRSHRPCCTPGRRSTWVLSCPGGSQRSRTASSRTFPGRRSRFTAPARGWSACMSPPR